MTSRVMTCSPHDSMQQAQEIMRAHHFRHVPVVEGGKVIGMLSLRDTLALQLHETEEQVNLLRDLAVVSRH